ncbi:hypothetical protein CSOJ01_07249 [Colletotrichum sojae]|uniref:Uncharacterized protein n=1 Tax=Colletotrichum sojae TaxID=2175907 RepID=A0A8H6J9D2_9PEZI|nr:hypothetical protein CSOJ01_07249 [Colletotrichum sojae]
MLRPVALLPSPAVSSLRRRNLEARQVKVVRPVVVYYQCGFFSSSVSDLWLSCLASLEFNIYSLPRDTPPGPVQVAHSVPPSHRPRVGSSFFLQLDRLLLPPSPPPPPFSCGSTTAAAILHQPPSWLSSYSASSIPASTRALKKRANQPPVDITRPFLHQGFEFKFETVRRWKDIDRLAPSLPAPSSASSSLLAGTVRVG